MTESKEIKNVSSASSTTSVYSSAKQGFFATLATILKDNWGWRDQIVKLARFEVMKKSRGAVLGRTWFFIRPAIYIFCFWFALDVGLRAGTTTLGSDMPPYILWLASGIIPWFFIQDMLGQGVNALRRYPYLVNKIKFPLSGVSTIFTGGVMLIQLMLQCALFVIYFLCGMPFDIYLLQVPILLVLMFLFFDVFSIGMSQLSAISKDFANLMKSLSTPFFWLSGVIFNVHGLPWAWAKIALDFNPITFFVSSFRDAFYYKTWFWENGSACIGFAVVFLVTLIFSVAVYRKFNEEVADVF